MPATATASLDIETPHGPARAHLTKVRGAVGAVVLGHGAGGGVGSRDLVAAAEVAQAEKFSVALVEQPYRVAGRRSPAPAHQLDAAWIAVVAHLRAKALKGAADRVRRSLVGRPRRLPHRRGHRRRRRAVPGVPA